jgi:RHO1 GDP-GTP exchange protein 1/2
MGRYRQTRRVSPSLCSPLRPWLHRSPTRRYRPACADYTVRCIWDGQDARTAAFLTPGPHGWGWDGRGTRTIPPPIPGGENEYDQEARVHAVMNAPDALTTQPGARPPKEAVQAQQVVELIRSIPLFLPGSSASPSASTHIPQSNSQPQRHSPAPSVN